MNELLAPVDVDMVNAINTALVNPDWFCEHILQSPNDIWQSEMMNAIADVDRIKIDLPTQYNHDGLQRFSIRAFHGPGKTHFLVKVAHWWNFTRKGVIPCTAPKLEQLKTRTWREFRKIRSGALKEYQSLINVDATRVQWCGDTDWCMNAESASVPDNLAGYHDDNLLFLVEEASGVAEEMFPAIEGAITLPGNILVLIGNPTRTSGEFYNSQMKPGTMELYYRKHIQHHETKRVTKEWINGMIAKYGRDSVVVKVRVFGEFVSTEKNQLIAYEWIEQARSREYEPTSFKFVRTTCDVSDGGVDETIVITSLRYADHTVFLKMERYSFEAAKAPIKSAEKTIEQFEKFGGEKQGEDDMVIDALGVGAGAAGYAIKLGYSVIAHRGGSTDNVDTKLYRNKRAKIHIALRNALRDGTVSFADDFCSEEDWDDVIGQLTSIRTKPGTERVEDIESKEEYVKREKKSPDILDAITMHFTDEAPTLANTGITETDYIVAPSVATQQDW